MKLVTNSIDSGRIRETSEDGDRVFIAKDVPFIRAQRLSNGYVPEQHVRASASEWDVPLTLNHPRNGEGDIISANTQTGNAVTVGVSEAPESDGDAVTANLRINADEAAELGPEGEALVESLENGEGIEVSSQYFADELSPGVYDGEYRGKVEGNLTPDSIALLPESKGVCSLPDCGIAPEQSVTANAADESQHLSVTAAADENDQGLIRRGLALLGAAVSDGSDVETATGRATANCDCDCSESESDERAESRDADPTSNQSSMVEVDKETLIQSIANQIDLDESTLQELGDDAIKVLYQSAVKGSSGDTSGEEGGEATMAAQPQPPTGNSDVSLEGIPDAVASGEQSLDEYMQEFITANEEESEKKEAVDRLVANSEEFGEDDRDSLLDAPLELIEGHLETGSESTSPGLPGTGTATANALGDTPDLDEFGTGAISQ